MELSHAHQQNSASIKASPHSHLRIRAGSLDMLGIPDLEAFIANQSLQAEVISLPVRTLTVKDAARAVGTVPERIIKSLLFLVDDQPVLAIASGTGRVDRRPIAAYFGVGRKRVKLADPDTVLAITGYTVGAVPPFGHHQSIQTLIDHRVLELPQIFAGGGAEDALLRVDPQEILQVTNAIRIDLHPPQERDQ
jgi:prolyl-tRNA editing enzyme YbaK/EbsC (Cys-tRNA(Pro) deacylase)